MKNDYPQNFLRLKDKYPDLISAYESAGMQARKAGPLDEKTTHLVQLAACVALRSEGGVHSHVRRLLQVGSTPEEICHSLVLLISTAGFPAVAAAFSWAQDIFDMENRTHPTFRV
jgi:4-carboxymuconolactone decarboxylase